jgi:hypothetical protein
MAIDKDPSPPPPPGVASEAPAAERAPEAPVEAAPADPGRVTSASSAAAPRARPDLIDTRRPVYRECQGYRLRLDPADLARLRELPGARGRSDEELGETFFDGQAERLAASLTGDVPTPAEIHIVVDPYSRQAFLALANRIRGIVSF